jgi:hypothetical protein
MKKSSMITLKFLHHVDMKALFSVFLPAGVFFMVSTIRAYYGNHHFFYTDLYQHSLGKFPYTFDVFIQNSIAKSSSVLYDIVAYTGFDLDDDIHGFGAHLFLTLIAALSILAILKNDFDVVSTKTRLLFLFCASTISTPILLDSVRPGYLYTHSGTPSMFAHGMTFILFFLALRRLWLWVGLLAGLMVLLTLKVSWFPIAMVALFTIVIREGSVWRFAWFLVPMSATFFITSGAPLPDDAELRRELVELVIRRNGREDSMHLQQIFRLALFVLSMPVYLLVARQIKNLRTRLLLYSVLFGSVIVALTGGLYNWAGYQLYPDPRLVLLSAVRSMWTYHFFFILLSIYWVGTRIWLSWVEKAILLLSFNYFLISPHGRIPAICFIAMAFVWRFTSKNDFFRGFFPRWRAWRAPYPPTGIYLLTVFLMLLPPLATVIRDYSGRLNLDDFQETGQWTIFSHRLGHDPELIKGARRLRPCPDFILLPLTGRGHASQSAFANQWAGKSKYIGDYAHFYLNLKMYEEYQRRIHIFNRLWKALMDKSRINKILLSNLRKDRVAVLAPTQFTAQLKEVSERVNINKSYALWFFTDPTDEFLTHTRKCINM